MNNTIILSSLLILLFAFLFILELRYNNRLQGSIARPRSERARLLDRIHVLESKLSAIPDKQGNAKC